MARYQRDADGTRKTRDAKKRKQPAGKRRRCKGTTVKGKPCQAAALKGQDYCSAHDPVSPGFGTPEQAKSAALLGGRPKLVRPSEIAQRLIEDNALAIQRPYWRALGYEVKQREDGDFYLEEIAGGGAKIHATWEGEVSVSTHDDLGAQAKAASELQDRAYGKARQISELSGPNGGPIEGRALQTDLSKLTVEEREQLLSLTRKAAA